MDNTIEIWKDIPEYEGIYQVSNFGRVKSLSREKLNRGKYSTITKEIILRPGIHKGYYHVNLHKKTRKTIKVHKLVAMAFLNHIPCGENEMVVDHKDNNPTNNKLDNLQIITKRENCSKDKKNKSSKYTGVSKHKFNNMWQVHISINGKRLYLGLFKDEQEANLIYQKALEMYNNGDMSFVKPKQLSSKFKGVCWNKRQQKWHAYININKKQKHIGFFSDEYEAHLAVQKALNI